MSFERPLFALLLLGLPPLLLLIVRGQRLRRQAVHQLGGDALRPLWRERLSLLLIASVWLFATLAVMGPMLPSRKGQRSPLGEAKEEILYLEEGDVVQGQRPFHDVIVLLDASASMGVSDTRVGLSRLEYAKEIVDELMSRLDGQSVALYAFTSELTRLLPATIDYLYARLLLRSVRINEGDVAGTDLAEALDGVRRVHFSPEETKARTLLLLTDGGDTRLEEAQGEERERHLEALASRIRGVENLQTFCIGLGSHEGEEIPGIVYNGGSVRSSLDESLLTALSKEGGGHFLFANDYSALTLVDYLLSVMDRGEMALVDEEVAMEGQVRRTIEPGAPPLRPPERRDGWPLFFAALALVAELAIPSRIRQEVLCATS